MGDDQQGFDRFAGLADDLKQGIGGRIIEPAIEKWRHGPTSSRDDVSGGFGRPERGTRKDRIRSAPAIPEHAADGSRVAMPAAR